MGHRSISLWSFKNSVLSLLGTPPRSLLLWRVIHGGGAELCAGTDVVVANPELIAAVSSDRTIPAKAAAEKVFDRGRIPVADRGTSEQSPATLLIAPIMDQELVTP